MKVWVTKYALTNGIIEGEGGTISENSIDLIMKSIMMRGFMEMIGILTKIMQ